MMYMKSLQIVIILITIIINGYYWFHCYIISTKRAPSSPSSNHFKWIQCIEISIFLAFMEQREREKKNSANDKNKFILIITWSHDKLNSPIFIHSILKWQIENSAPFHFRYDSATEKNLLWATEKKFGNWKWKRFTFNSHNNSYLSLSLSLAFISMYTQIIRMCSDFK